MNRRTAGAGANSGGSRNALDRVLHVGLIALLIAGTMNGLALEWHGAGTELTLRPDQAVLLLLMPLVVLAFVIGRFRFQLMPFEWLVAAFVASNFAASLLSSSGRPVGLKGPVLLAAYAAMYFVVRQILTNRPEWLPRATAWTLGLGIAQALYCLIALVVYASGYAIGGLHLGHLRDGSVAIKGTFWEPNLLGAYFGVIAVFLTVRYVWRPDSRQDAMTLFGVFVTSLALPLTITRAAAMAMAIALLAVGVVLWVFRDELLRWRARAARILLTFAAVMVLTLTAMDDFVSHLSRYPNFLVERWVSISSAIGEDPSGPSGVGRSPSGGDVTRLSRSSVDGRRQAWVLAFAHWQERPLFGHGTLAGGHLVKDGWWYSSLVQALYDTGLFGFAVLVALYTGALALPVRAWVRTRRTSDVNLLGFGAGNTILMVASQFSSFLFVGFPWIFLGLSMAAVQAARHAERKEETAGRRSPISAAELPHAARDERTG